MNQKLFSNNSYQFLNKMTQNNGCKTRIHLSDVYKIYTLIRKMVDTSGLKGGRKILKANGPDNQDVIVILISNK